MERATRFYTDVFGAEVRFSSPDWTSLVVAGAQIGLHGGGRGEHHECGLGFYLEHNARPWCARPAPRGRARLRRRRHRSRVARRARRRWRRRARTGVQGRRGWYHARHDRRHRGQRALAVARPLSETDLVLVVDFGAQYAQLIARRVREAHVYSEIVPRSMPVSDMLARRPKAIILSGGPASVHVPGAPGVDAAIYDSGVPILGICYGAQLVARDLGGEVAKTGQGEYGRTDLHVEGSPLLFADQPGAQVVWMSHGDSITRAPEGFAVTARTDAVPVAAFEDRDRAIYGVQFHPEVAHTQFGMDVLKAFLYDGAGCRPTWTNVSIIEHAVAEIRAQVGDARGICGVSGGVASAVGGLLGGCRRAGAQGGRRPVDLRVRRHGLVAARGGRAGRADVSRAVRRR